MADIIQRIACKAVIGKDGRVLVLREAKTYVEGTNVGRWQCPGGRVEIGEPYLGGLKREVMEETGLEVQVNKPIYVGEWFPVIKDVQNQIVAIFFACIPVTDTVVLSEEHDDYKWVTSEEAKLLDMASPEQEVITTYFETFS